MVYGSRFLQLVNTKHVLNVDRYGTEEEIREEMAHMTGWENSDMCFSSDDGYSVTINLGVMPDGE